VQTAPSNKITRPQLTSWTEPDPIPGKKNSSKLFTIKYSVINKKNAAGTIKITKEPMFFSDAIHFLKETVTVIKQFPKHISSMKKPVSS